MWMIYCRCVIYIDHSVHLHPIFSSILQIAKVSFFFFLYVFFKYGRDACSVNVCGLGCAYSCHFCAYSWSQGQSILSQTTRRLEATIVALISCTDHVYVAELSKTIFSLHVLGKSCHFLAGGWFKERWDTHGPHRWPVHPRQRALAFIRRMFQSIDVEESKYKMPAHMGNDSIYSWPFSSRASLASPEYTAVF